MEIQRRVEEHLRVLCEEIGARPTGSRSNHKAVEYVFEQFRSAGLDVRKQEFDCMDWKNNGGTLVVEGKAVKVVPAPYSLPCSLQGELICIHTLSELRTASLADKIVLLCDELAAEPLMPKSFVFWNPDEHKEIIALLEQGGARAVLTASLSPDRFIPVIEDGDFVIPCAVVLPESLPQPASGLSAALTLDTKRNPAKSANVLAVYGDGDQKICLSAHIDTNPGTPGALDNGSGVAVLLALAEELSGREFSYQIEFVLFNGEDYYSNPGEMLYLGTYLLRPEDYALAFNIDGAGRKGENTTFSFYGCPEKATYRIAELAEEYGGFEQTEPWPQGDHTLFSLSGVPVVAVTSSGIFDLADSVLHTEQDTLDWIDTQKLEILVNFLYGFLVFD